ncbi:RNA polymerase sigma factor [Aliikangiella sp. IMCC44653]
MQQSDQEIVKQLLAGNEKVFESLFASYYPLMYSIAQSITGSSIADEVIQEAWMSALKALPKFEGRSSLKSWLLRIVANEAKTRLRKEKRSVSLESMQDNWNSDQRFDSNAHWANPSAQWDGDSPEAILASQELKNCITKSLSQLPENQKAALRLRDASGLSMDEICNILDVSPSNLRVLLHRGRDKVLQVISHFQETGEC